VFVRYAQALNGIRLGVLEFIPGEADLGLLRYCLGDKEASSHSVSLSVGGIDGASAVEVRDSGTGDTMSAHLGTVEPGDVLVGNGFATDDYVFSRLRWKFSEVKFRSPYLPRRSRRSPEKVPSLLRHLFEPVRTANCT
jgi:hypothetical protein